jgi:hypothetical protein
MVFEERRDIQRFPDLLALRRIGSPIEPGLFDVFGGSSALPRGSLSAGLFLRGYCHMDILSVCEELSSSKN